jgi:hypothetical protein
VFDATDLNNLDRRSPESARAAWDTLHAVASLQGVVNRDGPRLFLRFMPHPDDFWFAYLRDETPFFGDRPVVTIPSFEALLARFAADLEGAVLYTEDVWATSNLASTIAGVEDRIALRYDPDPTSVYSRVMATGLPFTRDPVRLFREDGSPLFTGVPGTPIPGTALLSTGSAKCDAYLWAKERYLDTGLASDEDMAFYIDSYWLTAPDGALSNSTLTNHDYFISRKAFFFDLHVWEEEAPVDDPDQAPGTDLETLKQIMGSMARHAGYEVFHIGGFIPWAWKYSSHGNAGSKHGGVDSEWKYAQIISAYNGVMDADALGYSGMTNASFYQHYPLRRRYPQNPKPTDADLRERGLLLEDGTVAPYVYMSFYMGDYDAAAWLTYHVPLWWEDPARGRMPCNWAFNPNLDRRAPHVLDYVRTHQAPTDWFIAGDCGAGYLNPGMLTAPRLDPDIPDGWDAWIRHNRRYFKQYDLSINGFVIDGHSPGMGERGLDAYAGFAPDGLAGQKIPAQGLHKGILPYVRMATDLGGNPDQAGRQMAGMVGIGGPKFMFIRTILKSPSWHEQACEVARSEPGGDRIRYVDAYTFFRLLKIQEQNRAARRAGSGPYSGIRTIRFAPPDTTEGVASVAPTDGRVRVGEVGGRAVLQRAPGAAGHYLYFEIAPEFAAGLSVEHPGRFEVRATFFDAEPGRLVLEYDSADINAANSAYKSCPEVVMEGTGTWRELVFSLEDALFAGSQNGGASFRFWSDGCPLQLADLSVRRLD